MSKVLDKTNFLMRILVFQQLINPDLDEYIFEFERDGIDDKTHIYTGIRTLKNGEWEFRLFKYEKEVTYLGKSVVSFDYIVEELATLYRTKGVPLPRHEDWKSYFLQLKYDSRDLETDLEILAAWVDFYTRAGCTTKTDLSTIMEYKFPDNSPNKLTERIINQEIKESHVIEKPIKSFNKSSKTKTLFWTSYTEELIKERKSSLTLKSVVEE